MLIHKDGTCDLEVLEAKYSNLETPIHIGKISCVDLLDQLSVEESELEHRQAADDDEITHSERAAIGPDATRLRVKRAVIEAMTAQVTAYEVEQSLAS